jgi:hypothetical protein
MLSDLARVVRLCIKEKIAIVCYFCCLTLSFFGAKANEAHSAVIVKLAKVQQVRLVDSFFVSLSSFDLLILEIDRLPKKNSMTTDWNCVLFNV